MSSVNKVIILGNLGKAPEVKSVGERKVASFSIATSESYKDKAGAKQTTTTWHNIVAWSPLAEIIEKYVAGGDKIYVEGKISNRSYDDKDGNKKFITEIVARDITLLGGKGASEGSQPAPTGNSAPPPVDDTDNLPF